MRLCLCVCEYSRCASTGYIVLEKHGGSYRSWRHREQRKRQQKKKIRQTVKKLQICRIRCRCHRVQQRKQINNNKKN